MPTRQYDLDELLAKAESGATAPEIIEYFGLSITPRAVQRVVNKYLGPRPKHPRAKPDKLRRAAVAWMTEHNGLDQHRCVNGHFSASDCSIRFQRDADLSTAVFVCKRCVRAGDV